MVDETATTRNIIDKTRFIMYRAVTQNIEVIVEPFYLEEQSNPEENRYVWGYRITIANESDGTVRLRARYWKITDGNGQIEEIRGPGVIGEQPVLNPGDSFQYSSGCPLTTTSGVMVGRYSMESETGNIRGGFRHPFRQEMDRRKPPRIFPPHRPGPQPLQFLDHAEGP